MWGYSMDVGNISPTVLVSLGVVAGAFIFGFFGLLAVSIFRFGRARGWFGESVCRISVREKLDEFAEKVRMLEQKRRVLGAYSAEYFNTLQEAGWDEVAGLIDNLRAVEGSLQIMFEQKRYSDVSEVCDYLMGRLSPEEAKEVEEAYEGLSCLLNWRQQSREMFLRVIQATTSAAEQTQELGIQRTKRNRKPTLVSLADLRGALGEL